MNWKKCKDYIFGFLTSQSIYDPPKHLVIPEGYNYNPYVKGLITKFKSPLQDGMIRYDDGTKSSVPQMAYDLTEFISFLYRGKMPEYKMWALTY